MALVITPSKLKQFPEREVAVKIERPEGLLTSNYKSVAACNFKNFNSNSIFGIRQSIKSRQLQYTSSIDTILKLSVFAIVLSAIL